MKIALMLFPSSLALCAFTMIYSKLSSAFDARIEPVYIQNNCPAPALIALQHTKYFSELELAPLFGALIGSIDSVCTQYCDHEHDSSNGTPNCSHTDDAIANEQICVPGNLKVHGIMDILSMIQCLVAQIF